jgi:biopolymer transport protein TolQ
VDHPFVAALLRSGPVGQFILAGLLCFSVYTWTVIFSKSAALGAAYRSCLSGLSRFREGGIEWFEAPRTVPLPGPLGRVLAEGLREYRVQRELSGGGPLDSDGVARLESALEAETIDRITELERGHLGLGIAASSSPFIGLFGTVWGIMNSFRGMSLQGSAGIAAVAPGIAEALITTAAGIGVAVPAVIAYNVLNRKVQLVTTILDRFSAEFVRVAVAASRRGSVMRASAAPATAPEGTSSLFARRNA